MSISFKNYCMFTDFEKVSMFFRNNYVPYPKMVTGPKPPGSTLKDCHGLIL